MIYRINYDLSSIGPALNEKVAPLMNQAVRAVAMATQAKWQDAVQNAKLWSGEKDAYAASIKSDMTGPLSAFVYADYKHALEIETGRPPRDLKKMLDTSMKVRVSKKGVRYLIIPFRHGVPGSNSNPMPPDIYRQAKALTASTVLSKTTRLSGTGAWDIKTRKPATVKQNIYQWGGRLTGDSIPRNQQGMVRFDTSSPGSKRSTYLTFRVMSQKSSGWIVPAQPGQYIAKKVADEMRPKAEAAFAEAVKRSLT